MNINRRTFNQTILAAAATMAVPIEALSQHAQGLRAQYGDYFVLGFSGKYERANGRIWSRIDRLETWETIRKHGLYESATDTWWIKLAAFTFPNYQLDAYCSPTPAGGTMSLYASQYSAFCSDGKLVNVRKNKVGEVTIPSLLHTSSVPILCPKQVMLYEGEKPHIQFYTSLRKNKA